MQPLLGTSFVLVLFAFIAQLHHSQGIVLFQLVDSSHFLLFVNWWVAALENKAIGPSWNLHIACIGNGSLPRRVGKMHAPGCSQQLGSDPLTLKRIWYTKAKALVDCIKQTKDDVLLVDLDAILVRDPTSTYISSDSSQFDIISSRDHGPERLMHGKHWGLWRLCAGMVFYRYSPHLVDFLENVLVRVDRLGNDQLSSTSFSPSRAWSGTSTETRSAKSAQRTLTAPSCGHGPLLAATCCPLASLPRIADGRSRARRRRRCCRRT